MNSHKVKKFLLPIFRFYRCCERKHHRTRFVDLKQKHDKNNCQQYSKSDHHHANNKGIDLLCQDFQFPDITGNYAATDWFRDISKITSSGALFNDTSKGSRSQTGASGYTGSQTVGFQAAKSNATFGKSSIVQPKAFYTLMIVKV